MAVTVKLRLVRHSARKLAPVTRIVQGKKLSDAIDQTAVMPQHSARDIHKVLKMAASAAIGKEFNVENLVVTQIFATQGPKIRRQRPNARGRANRYLKHLAHLTVIVDEAKPATEKKRTKKAVDQAKEAPQPEGKKVSAARSRKGTK